MHLDLLEVDTVVYELTFCYSQQQKVIYKYYVLACGPLHRALIQMDYGDLLVIDNQRSNFTNQ